MHDLEVCEVLSVTGATARVCHVWYLILVINWLVVCMGCLVVWIVGVCKVNSLRPRQNARHFADIFNCILVNENVWISIKISLKFIPKDPINNVPALVQILAWRRPGDKPISEPMMISLLTHKCVTRLQLVKTFYCWQYSYYFLYLTFSHICRHQRVVFHVRHRQRYHKSDRGH